MIQLILAALIAAAPAPPAPAPKTDHAGHHEGMKHEGPCCPKDGKPMDCCKDKPMPCCEKKAETKAPADAGAHNHAH
ncbi:hypothetical protein GCM10022280_19220 [Sphingomonas swuensis]|uniref:Uncharacterized protein n=1 Tax=Sphingomonas swuensis TaxID=977800 RepID=A0ABP7T1H5_9SPHN